MTSSPSPGGSGHWPRWHKNIRSPRTRASTQELCMSEGRPPATQHSLTDSQAAQPSLISLPPRTKLTIIKAVLLCLFLTSLDQTVVGTALPRIITDLNEASLYAWVVTAY